MNEKNGRLNKMLFFNFPHGASFLIKNCKASASSKVMSYIDTEKLELNLIDTFRRARIFLLDDPAFKGEHLAKNEICNDDLGLPFKTCWFESADDTVLFAGKNPDDPSLLLEGEAMLVDEISPNVFMCHVLLNYRKDGIKDPTKMFLQTIICGPKADFIYKSFSSTIGAAFGEIDPLKTDGFGRIHHQITFVIKQIIERINNCYSAEEGVHKKISFKTSSGAKREHTIRTIIRIAGKNKKESKPLFSKEIKWSHRFEVRGHWRDLPGGIGKDREGNYCVNDYTWVSHYTKGDESLPLIKKTRMVETSAST